MNDKFPKIFGFTFAVILHIVLILFLVIETNNKAFKPQEYVRIMKVTDLAESIPPSAPGNEIVIEDEIAEIMTETDTPPVQDELINGALNISSFDGYYPNHMVSFSPYFDENAIVSEMIYPPLALRAGIEGRVLLELFVDKYGVVQNAVVLREEPPGRGFGESAVRTFTGKKGTPAYINGEPAACRYRYPLMFRIN